MIIRFNIVCLIACCCINSFAQRNATLQEEFTQVAAKALGSRLAVQQLIDSSKYAGRDISVQNEGLGWGFLTKAVTDTLNRKNCIYCNSRITITDIDSAGNERPSALNDEDPQKTPMLLFSYVRGDTLFSQIGLFDGFAFAFTRSATAAVYSEYRKRDSVFRTSLLGKKSDFIQLPMKILVSELSLKNFRPGALVYGKIEMSTPVYYVDDPGFKEGYIALRQHMSIYFRMKPVAAGPQWSASPFLINTLHHASVH